MEDSLEMSHTCYLIPNILLASKYILLVLQFLDNKLFELQDYFLIKIFCFYIFE